MIEDSEPTRDEFGEKLIALLKAGADINASGEDEQRMPLHQACEKRLDVEFIRILLQHGADPTIKSDWSEDTKDWYREVMALLPEFAPTPSPAVFVEKDGKVW